MLSRWRKSAQQTTIAIYLLWGDMRWIVVLCKLVVAGNGTRATLIGVSVKSESFLGQINNELFRLSQCIILR